MWSGAAGRNRARQVEGLALARHMGDGLHDHRIRGGPEPLEDPVSRALVGGSAGNARPELHLLLQVAEGALAGEFVRAPPPPPAGAALCGACEGEREAGRQAPSTALSSGHRVVMSCRDLGFGI